MPTAHSRARHRPGTRERRPRTMGVEKDRAKSMPIRTPCKKSALENASADTASPSINPCAEDVPLANINHRATQQAPCAKNALIRALRAKTAFIRAPWAKTALIRNPWARKALIRPDKTHNRMVIPSHKAPQRGRCPTSAPQDTLLRAFGRETPSYESISRPTPSYHCCFRPVGSYGRISRPTDSARRRLPARPWTLWQPLTPVRRPT